MQRLCGLFLGHEYPFLGSSPDDLVECKCCGEGLLEIKWVFLYQNKMTQDTCIDNNSHVVLDENENDKSKFDSPWYEQVQCQLGHCHKEWCDFVVFFFTKKGFIVYILINIFYQRNCCKVSDVL